MKIAIVGSRNFTDYKSFKDHISGTIMICSSTEIVSGGARGTDAMAKRLAEDFGCKYTEFPADWDTYGKSAGYIRNRKIAEYSEIGIAFVLGESKGTKITIKEFEKLDKLVFKIEVD